jgi:acetoin utilization protein AcuB
MLVGERMKQPVITVSPKMPIQAALSMMHAEEIRRLPIVDEKGRLMGIVSESDLLHASPSDATSLSIWELNYLLSQITVSDVMTRKVITVGPDSPIEEVARIMADNKIGGIPVVEKKKVIGIITETDLFKIFLEMFCARDPGVRLTALVPDVPGELARLTKAIFDIGGNIIALGTFQGESVETRTITMKVEGVDAQALEGAVKPYIKRVIDIREIS